MTRLPVTPLRPFHNALRSTRRFLRRRGSRNPVRVLGLCSTGHGAAMALVSSDHPPRALQLERYCGRKHALFMSRDELDELRHGDHPIARGLRALLAHRGRLPPILVFEDHWRPFFDALTRGLDLGPEDVDLVVSSESHFAVNRAWLGSELSRYFPRAVVRTDFEHHAVHGFQAFYPSPFERAAVLTADACGEKLRRLGGTQLAMTLGEADADGFKVFAEHPFPRSSPGLLYQGFNHFLGFRVGQEGKTMGLAPYGSDRFFHRLSEDHLELFDDGSFRFLEPAALEEELRRLGASPRSADGPILPEHQDVAWAGQALVEKVLVHAVRALERSTTASDLCFAGGVALNSVANEVLLSSSRFERLYVMPNAGDNGQALGCALHGFRRLTGRRPPALEHDYLGPPYGKDEILRALADAGLDGQRLEDPVGRAVELLAAGRIVAWFEGGSEFGPRALGHRSLLADCRPPGVRDHLNARVKLREAFRPFAPVVPEELAADWFELDGPSPFMLRVVRVRSERRLQVPGITHVDGTARVQTVSRDGHPELHRMLGLFGRRTGVPVLLNTSFNVAGKPIVETPGDAVACFLGTGIDALFLQGILVEKPTRAQASARAKSRNASADE